MFQVVFFYLFPYTVTFLVICVKLFAAIHCLDRGVFHKTDQLSDGVFSGGLNCARDKDKKRNKRKYFSLCQAYSGRGSTISILGVQSI